MELYTNFSKSTLAAGIASGATSMTFASGTGALFPSPTAPDFARLVIFEIGSVGETNQEIVYLTARSGDTATITRGQEGTTARTYAAGAYVALRPTAAQLTDMRPNSLHVKETVVFESEHDFGNSGASITLDLTTRQKARVTLNSATPTLTFSALASNRVGHYQVRVIQDATGGRLPAIVGVGSDQWLNSATVPDFNLVATGETVLNLYWTGAKFIASASKVGA